MTYFVLLSVCCLVYRMATESDNNLERYKSEGHTAFVLGYTGESGKVLTRDLNRLKLFKKVVLIGRREVTLDPSFGSEFVSCVVVFLSHVGVVFLKIPWPLSLLPSCFKLLTTLSAFAVHPAWHVLKGQI